MLLAAGQVGVTRASVPRVNEPIDAPDLPAIARAALLALGEPGLAAARVACLSGEHAIVLAPSGPRAAVVPPRLLDPDAAVDQRVVVGDWVAVRDAAAGGEVALVRALLPRNSLLARKAPGRAATAQLLAANVDVLFAVTAFGEDLAPRRLERYVVVARAGGVVPVVVLNKADHAEDAAVVAADLRRRLRVDVALTCALTEDGAASLAPWLAPGTTVAFVGSSGVGKSSLVNRCLGTPLQAVGAVRAGDDKGRHTTTRRELVVAPSGFVLVDTPGLREIAPWADADDVAASFDDVEEVAAGCRFRDCRHGHEPGCAVREAAADGRLDADRVGSRARLVREADDLARRVDPAARREAKQHARAQERGLRARLRAKGR